MPRKDSPRVNPRIVTEAHQETQEKPTTNGRAENLRGFPEQPLLDDVAWRTFEATVALFERGLKVVPVDQNRECHLPEWQTGKYGIEHIVAALQKDGHAGIALVLNLSPFIDVECDTPEAEQTFLSWCGGQSPRTPTWKSRRGPHRLCKRPEGISPKACKAKLMVDGVEIRGLSTEKGALSVVPPSYGRECLPGLSLDAVEPMELPPALIERVRNCDGKEKESGEATRGDIHDGTRNDTLLRDACKLFGAGMAADMVLSALRGINAEKCKPPLDDAEVQKIVQNAGNHVKKEKSKSRAERLADLVNECCELWHTPDRTAYVTFSQGGHKENWPLHSHNFDIWLRHQFYKKTDGAVVHAQAVQDCLRTLEAKAIYEGPEHEVSLRVAGDDTCIYLDLCDAEWRAVKITAEGWEVVNDPPVKFRRGGSMLPLPVPVRGGSIRELDSFLSLSRNGRILFKCYLLACLRPSLAYPILRIYGEHGSTKTTHSKLAKWLIDPSVGTVRKKPKSLDDLLAAAKHSHLNCLDNLSHINVDLSDFLCSLATGIGDGKRKLYSDDDLNAVQVVKPIIVNGIEIVGNRSDFTDRCVSLEAFRPAKRRGDSELKAAFDEAHPRILGALLNGVATAIRELPAVRASGRDFPRMCDFAQWSEAGMDAFDKRGYHAFRQAYEESRMEGHRLALESSIIYKPLLKLLEMHEGKLWDISTSDLLEKLSFGVDTRAKAWPKQASSLSGILNRLLPDLRAVGFTIYSKKKSESYWFIEKPKDANPKNA